MRYKTRLVIALRVGGSAASQVIARSFMSMLSVGWLTPPRDLVNFHDTIQVITISIASTRIINGISTPNIVGESSRIELTNTDNQHWDSYITLVVTIAYL